MQERAPSWFGGPFGVDHLAHAAFGLVLKTVSALHWICNCAWSCNWHVVLEVGVAAAVALE